jgi:hypothetical protein
MQHAATPLGLCRRAAVWTTSTPSSSIVACGPVIVIIGCRCGLSRAQHEQTMSITFPNPSRYYDPSIGAVRFWGYDSAMEASFFVTVGALQAIAPRMTNDEVSILTAFDDHRDRICDTAARVYARGHKGSYDLTRSDF